MRYDKIVMVKSTQTFLHNFEETMKQVLVFGFNNQLYSTRSMGAVGVVLQHMLNNFVFTVAMKNMLKMRKGTPRCCLRCSK